MKKVLLLAAAAMMAASASAQAFPEASPIGENDVDVTPAGYHFNKYGKFIGFSVCQSAADWNMDANWYKNNFIDGEEEFGDGVISVLGAFNGNADAVAKFNEAAKIVDLGGTTGKVLAINHHGSKFAEAYEGVTGVPLEIGEAPGGFPLFFFHFDHNKLMKYTGTTKDDKDYMPLRIRIEMNMFCNVQAGEKKADGNEVEYWKSYINDDENNVRPAGKEDNVAGNILVKPSEFAYRWCEKDESDPFDDSIWDKETEDGVWNPNRWLVYEWDFNMADPIEGESYKWNIKLKNEVPGGANGNFTTLIRDISVYVPEKEDREYIYKARPRTWNFYTTGAPASVESVAVEAEALTYTVNGGEVTFSAPVKVYNMAGAMVAEGQSVSLGHGVYVAQAGAQTVKIAVK